MGILRASLAVLCVVQATWCTPVKIRSAYAVKETHYVPAKWSSLGAPQPLHMIDLHIGLKQENFDELERQLYAVSHPANQRYGQHLSKEEVEDLIRPSKTASDLVSEWLADHGIESHDCKFSPAGDWISISMPVSDVERLLDTTYSIYEHEDGTRLARTTSWSLPLDLHEHITTIQPTTAFLRANPHGVTSQEVPGQFLIPAAIEPNETSISAACNFSAMTTGCLRTLYNTINYTPQVPGQNQIGFTNYLGEVTNRSDAAIFLSNFRPEAVSSAQSFTQISIDGGPIDNGTDGAGLEGNLDIETILGLVWPTPATSYSTGGSPPYVPDAQTTSNTNEPYLTWLTYILSQPAESVPQVISTSYGDDEQTVPLSYATTVCSQIAQLGARGVSVLFSSGDFGVGPTGNCQSNNGSNANIFIPAFPASCPYVTTVGGTKEFPEVVAYDANNGFASGSGFSNYFPRPDYQTDVVQAYIDSLDGQYAGLYNASGRAYPDLAAQAYRYLTIYGGAVRSLDGTSASCPTVASIIALVNDALLANGKSTLGWLNPWLYSTGHTAFTDVTAGSSIGCGVDGFAAAPGWDVASGWGTPDFEKILDVLGVGNGTAPASSTGSSR